MCNRTNYEFYKKHHICVRCGQENAERNHILCFRCMIKSREQSLVYNNKHREERKEKSRINSRNRYYRLKESGVCTSCGKRKTEYNKVMCKHCSAKINARKRAKYLLNVYATRNMAEIRV